jgi:hypothetical protein
LSSSAGQNDALSYTISHFKEIARQNLFAENGRIGHDHGRCAVCNPGIAGSDPFSTYLQIIAESILVRRPGLDEALVAEINADRAMIGFKADATVDRLLQGDPDMLGSWIAWVREALAAGLGLLSIHSPASLDFDLDEQEELGHRPLIESTVRHIMDSQKWGAETHHKGKRKK